MAITKTPVRKVQPTPQATLPMNLPKPSIRRYVPPAPKTNSNFQDRANKWIDPKALEVYDPLLLTTVPGVFAWIPMPMFSSQEPAKFCDTRYFSDNTQFDEWSYGISLVRRAGTDMQKVITFCPYKEDADTSEEFISSPYATLYHFVASMNRDRKFSEASPWWYLLEGDKKGGKFRGMYLPPIKTYFLMISIMLAAVKNTYNRETKTPTNVQEIYYNPATIGKGIAANEKLTVLAISTQVWSDLVKVMNTRTPDGNWLYPDVCNPDQLAVFYAWAHKTNPNSPVPGVVSTTKIDGMSGTVAGQLFDVNGSGNIIGGQFKLPPYMLTPQKTPTKEYFDKVPMHVGETVRRMDDFTMIKELAAAFSDAKAIFDLAFKQTDYEQYLDEPEIKSIFGATPQKFIYDSSIFTGAPTHHQVVQPPPVSQQQQFDYGQQAQQHGHAVQQIVHHGATMPPPHPYQPPHATQGYTPPQQMPVQPPVQQAPAPPAYTNPFPNMADAKAAAVSEPISEIYENDDGYATDYEGNLILDQYGRPQLATELAAAMDQPPWV